MSDAGESNDDRTILLRYVSLVTLGIVSFSYLFAATQLVGLSPKLRDVAIYTLMSLVVAPFCGFLLSRRGTNHTVSGDVPTMFTATAALATLVIIQSVSSFAPQPKVAWALWAYRFVLVLPLVHILAVLTWRISKLHNSKSNGAIIGAIIPSAFVLVASVSVVCLFWFDPGTPAWSGHVALLRSRPFVDAGASFVATAFIAAGIFLSLVVFAALFDQSLFKDPSRRAFWGTFLLAASSLFAIVMYFDFSLSLEPLHYLTNVGPAMAVRHGATPLVDAFSQYGPAPVMLTFLAYKVGPQTLSTAQILVQFCNITFYILWLFCLYRMSRFRTAAMGLGLMAIALQMAAWDFGSGNLNVAPSILGLRYLPSILLVLALNVMPEGRHQNWLSSVAVLIASAWSIETLISTLAVLLGYLTILNIRNRTPMRLATDMLFVAFLVFLSLCTFSVAAWARTGEVPGLFMYTRFLAVYNPLSDFWSFDANPQFYGWIVPLGTLFAVIAEATRLALVGTGGRGRICANTDPLFYRFLPMALLAMQMGAYFAFRSHDYTVATALLPTLAIIIPAGLAVAAQSVEVGWPRRWVLAAPSILVLVCATFAIVALGRPGSAYSFYLHQCRDQGRCTPHPLLDKLGKTAQLRDLLEPTGNPLSDRWIVGITPARLLSDASEAARAHAGDEARVSFLLGNVMVTDLATLYSDRKRHFPISFSYTDQLVPKLADRIIERANFTGEDGGIVIIRRDLNLTSFEQRLWNRVIGSVNLHELVDVAPTLRVFRVTSCSGPPLPKKITGCARRSPDTADR